MRGTDAAKRDKIIEEALKLRREVVHVPLHNQIIPWAMRKKVSIRTGTTG
jgi:peptide/nickel transport system substrate-binding protein